MSPKGTLSAEDRLILIGEKTKRAKKHLEELEAIARSGEGKYKHAGFGDAHKHTMYRLPVTPFAVMTGAGDMIHNLRSALDHLAWQLVLANAMTPSGDTSFPIAESLKKFQAMKIRKMRDMAPKAQQAIEQLHPYKGGNEPLWRIHYWDIVDKHRQLLAPYQRNLVEIGEGEIFGQVREIADFPGIFPSDTDPDAHYPNATPSIETEIPNVQPLIPTLHELLVFTENLIENFRPFLA